ncbi:MAG: dethiobiotin synthase [Chitinophagales bacterium]
MIGQQQILFVSGIGTEVGKTIVSAILVEAFQADYWKPIQAGLEDVTDAENIAVLAPHHGQVFEERFRLKTPMSPDASAARENVKIKVKDFELPESKNHLIVEGAGGLLVPLNESETVIDLIQHLSIPVVLVSRHYLGSINHSLLSIEALKARNIPIELLVFVGNHPETETSILQHSGIKKYIIIPEVKEMDSGFIMDQAKRINFL